MRRLKFYTVFAGLDDYIDYLLSSGTDTEPVKVGIIWAPLSVNLFGPLRCNLFGPPQCKPVWSPSV